MFGQNPIRPPEHGHDGRSLAVEEIFLTLQGEGPLSGRRAVFVRLAGCNLACTWCDTQFEEGMKRERMELGDVLVKCSRLAEPLKEGALVVITGGEPLRQNIVPLTNALLSMGFRVQIETAGILWQDLSESVVVVLSPKTRNVHPKWRLRQGVHWKYVVAEGDADPADGLPVKATQSGARDGIARPSRGNPADAFPTWDAPIWVSPRDDHDPARNAANLKHAATLVLRYGYRLSLQVHKIVGVA